MANEKRIKRPTGSQWCGMLLLFPFGCFLCWEAYNLTLLISQGITFNIPIFFYLLDVLGVFFFIHLVRNIIGPYLGWDFKRYNLYQRWSGWVCRERPYIKQGKNDDSILNSGIGFDYSDPNSDTFHK